MIEVKSLEFEYDSFCVRVSFDVKEGEVLTLLGPNGSGKTTILKCIYGLLRPKGCVLIDGKDFHEIPIKERAKVVGYVPQTHNPPFPYSVLDVVVMGITPQLGLFEVPKKEHYEKALEKLRLLGIEDLKNRPYTQLSGGQLQLVLIARALVQEPKILLLDEPTAHLDFKNQVQILDIVRKLTRSEGISAIMTLHDPNLASLYSDRIALIKNGSIVAIGKPEDVIREDLLEEVYEIPIRTFKLNGYRFILPACHPS